MANESVRAGTPSSPVPRYFSMPATSNMNAKASSGSSTPAVIAIVVLLGAALVMVSYYTMVARFCHGRLALPMLNRGMRRRNDDEEDQVQAGVMTWAVVEPEQVGVEEAIIQAIPVVEYRKFNWKEGTDCAVCLSQFEEEERVRLLPMCSHAFHLPCIDVWLRSHANCPLCRALISIQAHHPPSPTSQPSDNTAAAAAAVADDHNHLILIHITDEINTRERAHTPPTPKLQSLDREQPIKAGNLTINDRQAHGQNVGATTSDGVSKEVYKRLQLAPNSSRCFSMGRLQGFHSHRLDDGDYSQHMQITMSSNEKTSPLKSMGMQRSSSHK